MMLALVRSTKSLLIVIALLVTTNIAQCFPGTEPYLTENAALNLLQARLPDQMPLEARCQRYAFLLLMIETEGMPHRTAVLELITMHDDIFDMFKRNLDTNHLISLYMIAIDRYRISKLEPPFLDLVDCLSRIDVPQAKAYFNEELNFIVNLYKDVLDTPGSTIDLGSLDLSTFPPSMRTMLENLFVEHLTPRAPTSEQSQDTDTIWPQTIDDLLSDTDLVELQEQQPEIDSSILADPHARSKYLAQLRQKRHREKHLEKIREKDRIRKRKYSESPTGPASDSADTEQKPRRRQKSRPLEEFDEKQRQYIERERFLGRQRQLRFRQRNLEKIKQRTRENDRKRRAEARETKLQFTRQLLEEQQQQHLQRLQQQKQQQQEVIASQMEAYPWFWHQPGDGSLAIPSSESSLPSSSHGITPPVTNDPPEPVGSVDGVIGDLMQSYSSTAPNADIQQRCNTYNYIIDDGAMDEQTQFENLMSTMRTFEPVTHEQFDLFDDLLDCATFLGESDALVQELFDDEDPQTTGLGYSPAPKSSDPPQVEEPSKPSTDEDKS